MKFRIPPQTHLERLKLSAKYLSTQRQLKRAAWGSIGWGAFTLALALFMKTRNAFDAIWLTIGFFLVMEGVWILRSVAVDPRVLLVESFALMVLGLLNTVGFYYESKVACGLSAGPRSYLLGYCRSSLPIALSARTLHINRFMSTLIGLVCMR